MSSWAVSSQTSARRCPRRRSSSAIASGLYKAMADGAPVTPEELAERTGTDPRYVREWLSSQAAGGYVSVRVR
jgi:DNA-binding GntR family transcriptional regulator